MQFVLPQSLADWLPFAAALVTVLYGLWVLIAPGMAFQTIGERDRRYHARSLASARGDIGGFHLGVGLMVLAMYDQPFLQLALGAGWLIAAFGRLVSLAADRSFAFENAVRLLVSLALAGLSLAPPLGYLPV
ncbi:DUF4345 domain-containing protein [Consotaella salsifontis]|uniref:DUF4345 domain-containing protein n=1 Tax=Consotaella salsifontis TaxID=1365950 RepID=A0A1T4RX94_9HYPH|nr:DUF4345 domain-containing protein [Consotaella salsifontis]SKA20610.1 hypothetical protein SAMN05428963_10855 [Consotaella salsifontis]